MKLFLTVFLILISVSIASEKDPGAITFRDNCSACHQFDGSGNESMKAPGLAGLPRWYVSDQLRKFRTGDRGGKTEDTSGYLMHMTALKLDDRIIAYLGRHVQNLETEVKRKTKEFGSAEHGKKLYEKNCSSCHGENGIDNKPERVPPLNKQPDWYLLSQMQKFEKKLRQHSSENIPKLNEEEMKNIASFLVGLKEKN